MQRQRQVPVIEAEPGLDAVLQQFVRQPIIKIQSGRIWRAAPFRQHAAPRDVKAVGAEVCGLHQGNIFRIPMIMIAGDVSGVAVLHPARLGAERVPDAEPAPAFLIAALDLIGRS